jgi:hypothetical protein
LNTNAIAKIVIASGICPQNSLRQPNSKYPLVNSRVSIN